jgi:hypothetical protein
MGSFGVMHYIPVICGVQAGDSVLRLIDCGPSDVLVSE